MDTLVEKQASENFKMELDAKAEALDMYLQWKKAQEAENAEFLKSIFKMKEVPAFIIPKPRRSLINMYDEATALTNEDYARIRQEEYKRLKENYGKF